MLFVSQVKHSSSSLFDYLRQQTREELTRISNCILQIFSDFQGHERVIMPLLRFLDRLFNSGVLSNQDCTLPDDFAVNLVKLVSKETARCSAPLKLLEAIPVLCHFAGIRAEKKVKKSQQNVFKKKINFLIISGKRCCAVVLGDFLVPSVSPCARGYGRANVRDDFAGAGGGRIP